LSVTTEIDFAEGYRPGVIGRIAQMHAVYYAREWGFGAFLEAKIAGEAASFMERYDPATDLLLLAMSGDAIAGSIIVDLNDTASKDVEGSDRGAHISWFIIDDSIRGAGIGRKMMQRAVDHIDRFAEGRAWLTTFAGLDAARRLYEDFGFRLAQQRQDNTWGDPVHEQLYLRG
jgi:ribosomal protein S18 acetylase RimI-like enzyme